MGNGLDNVRLSTAEEAGLVVIQHDGVIGFRREHRINKLITAEEAALFFIRRDGYSVAGLGREDRRVIIGRGVFGDLWTMDT